MTLPSFLDDLNPQQRQAVETLGGPVLVLAGPGSGKTRVLTYRIAYLVRVCGIPPWRIMAVTFTNKAAREMKERLLTLLGEEAHRLTVGTFHAICARILRQEGPYLGIDRHFLIYDADDQLGLIRQAMRELKLDEKHHAPSATLYAISRAKDDLLDPDAYAARVRNYREEIVARVYRVYQRLLRENRALDFADLLMQAVRLFEEHPQVREQYQRRYQHVLVDEYQDTNHAQYVLVRHLSGGQRNLFVVGDEEQAIYAWRGATVRNILEFENDFPEARVLLLEQNYRSSQCILRAACSVIAAGLNRPYEKSLWTENSTGEPVILQEAYNEEEEARLVADEITQLLDEGYHPRDVAVMYRTNAQSRTFEEAFIRYGIRYKLVGGTRFYQRREVRDILAYLRLLHNPYDSVSMLRIANVPPRGIGARTIQIWQDWSEREGRPLYDFLEHLGGAEAPVPEGCPLGAQAVRALRAFRLLLDDLLAFSEETPLPDLLDELLTRIDYRRYLLQDPLTGEDRWENVQELRTVAQDYADPSLPPRDNLAAFLEETALVADIDEYDDRDEAVTLITLHQAKGLEFPVVFIVGLEEGLLPHIRSMDDTEELEEERRLCYVGMTRARERLYLFHAFKRTILGNSQVRTVSRFLACLDEDVVLDGHRQQRQGRKSRRTPSTRKRNPGRSAQQTPFFQPGDRVRHAVFGRGVVVTTFRSGNDQQVTVAFEEKGLRRLLAGLAQLEKI